MTARAYCAFATGIWLTACKLSLCDHVLAVGTAAGLIARLCNTLVVAASMAAVSESLAVGKRLGVDSKVLTQVRWRLVHITS